MYKKLLICGAMAMLPLFNYVCAQNTTQTMYIDFGEPDNDSRGHQTTGADANGNYWTNVKSSGNEVPSATTVRLINLSLTPIFSASSSCVIPRSLRSVATIVPKVCFCIVFSLL